MGLRMLFVMILAGVIALETPAQPAAGGRPELTKAYFPASVSWNGSTILTFTITNSSGNPQQSGISFTDTLPAGMPGLVFDFVVNNPCGGSAAVLPGQKQFAWTGGSLAAGTTSCQIQVQVRAVEVCGVFVNDELKFSDVSNLDASKATATLTAGCQSSGALTVSKKVEGAPPGFTGQFPFLIQCATPNGLFQQVVIVNYPAPGSVTVSGVPPGSTCTVTEGQMPPAPAGYNWVGLPVYGPPGGVVTTNEQGGQVTAINRLEPCAQTGQVRITKIVKGVPQGFSGTFTGTLQCWTAGQLSTFPVTLTAPNGLVAVVGNIPLGSTCTFTETSQSGLPGGMQWNPPVYLPPFGNVTLDGRCCQDVVVTNEARQCCETPEKACETKKE